MAKSRHRPPKASEKPTGIQALLLDAHAEWEREQQERAEAERVELEWKPTPRDLADARARRADPEAFAFSDALEAHPCPPPGSEAPQAIAAWLEAHSATRPTFLDVYRRQRETASTSLPENPLQAALHTPRCLRCAACAWSRDRELLGCVQVAFRAAYAENHAAELERLRARRKRSVHFLQRGEASRSPKRCKTERDKRYADQIRAWWKADPKPSLRKACSRLIEEGIATEKLSALYTAMHKQGLY